MSGGGAGPGQQQPGVDAARLAELVELCARFAHLKAFAHRRDPEIRRDRGRIAALLAGLADSQLPDADLPEVRTAVRVICGLQVCHHNLTPGEVRIADQLEVIANRAHAPNRYAALIAATLFRLPSSLVERPDLAAVPAPLLPWITELFSLQPFLFPVPGVAERVVDFTMATLSELEALVQSRPDDPAVKAARAGWLEWSSFLQCYFSERDLRPLMDVRGRLIAGHVRDGAPQLFDWQPPPRPADGPIRVGFYIEHVNEGTETVFTLAHFERLPRPEFHVTLLYRSTADAKNPFIRRVIEAADRAEAVPQTTGEAARMIRSLDLDVLFYGTNLAALPHTFATHLGVLRLARLQVATMCSPTTSGLPGIDAYLSTTLIQPPDGTEPPAQASYSERLWMLPGAMKQFAMPKTRQRSKLDFRRRSAGIPDDKVLLISGANYFKIIPELSRAWLEILRAAPQAHLALFPFNPNWSAMYQHEPFIQRLKDEAADIGVDLARITILKPLPHAADTLEYLRTADVYLDSYPYAGAVSMYDPLSLGLPVAAWEGHEARSRQCASVLRSLGLTDLIADSQGAYVGLVLDLVRDPSRRRRIGDRIAARMADGDPLNEGRDLEQRLAVRIRQEVDTLPSH